MEGAMHDLVTSGKSTRDTLTAKLGVMTQKSKVKKEKLGVMAHNGDDAR